MRVALLTVFIAGFSAASASPHASFDCAKAATPVEKLVCSDDDLATLDVEMAAVFGKLVATNPENVASIRESQRAWLGERGQCLTDKRPAQLSCLKDRYRQRQATLEGPSFLACSKPIVTRKAFAMTCIAPNSPAKNTLLLTGTKSDMEAELSRLSVIRAGAKAQDIRLDGRIFFDGLSSAVELVDVNFDGFADIKLATSSGAGPNMGYDYWLYVPKIGQYIATKLGEQLSGFDVVPDPKTKTILVNGKASCCQWEAVTYWWDRGGLRIRTITRTGNFTVSDIPGLETHNAEACGNRTDRFNDTEALVGIDFDIDIKQCDGPAAEGPSDPSKLLGPLKTAAHGFAVQVKDPNHFSIRFEKPLLNHNSL